MSVEDRRATYELLDGEALEVFHHGDRVTVQRDEPLRLPVPKPPQRPEPKQPPGRAPRRRRER